MTNERILKNWEAVIASIPQNAQVAAEFKTFEISNAYAKPKFINQNFIVSTRPKLHLDDERLERISATINYNKGHHLFEINIKLFADGCVEVEKEYGLSNEAPAKRYQPRFYPNEEQLKICFVADKAVFMHEWLTDFFTVLGTASGFKGHYTIGGTSSEHYKSEEDPSSVATRLITKAKRSGTCATNFEGIFERENSIRSDFIDRITVKVKENRRVMVEYKTYEKENIHRNCAFGCASQYVIGAAHETTDLGLTSELFPMGFVERQSKDFLVRFNNYSEGTCDYRPWPNRQICGTTAAIAAQPIQARK